MLTARNVVVQWKGHAFHTHISHVCEILHSETCEKGIKWCQPFHLIFTCILHAVSHVNSHWFAIRFHMLLHITFHLNFAWKISVNGCRISHDFSNKLNLFSGWSQLLHTYFTCFTWKFSANATQIPKKRQYVKIDNLTVE